MISIGKKNMPQITKFKENVIENYCQFKNKRMEFIFITCFIIFC